MNYIDPIKEALDIEMHKICQKYLETRADYFNPRWINISDNVTYTHSNGTEIHVQKINSTNSGLYFDIQYPLGLMDIDTSVFWKQFKEYRTTFLEENYPNIPTV